MKLDGISDCGEVFMNTFDIDKWEQEKRERRKLRGRQRSLTKRFLHDINTLSEQTWSYYAGQFQENLEDDIRLDPYWIDTERYLITIFNLFLGLGFKVYFGPMPRVSGVNLDYHFPLLAYDNNRAILVENSPTNLFADLADIQPRIPMPIVGLSYNSLATSSGKKGYNYAIDSLKRSKSIAGALALGHLTFSLDTLRESILLNPYTQTDQLKQLAARIGLVDFLRPPVDALPIFGQQASANNDLAYNIDQFLKDAKRTSNTGSQISVGDVTQATPDEALTDPDYYFRELEKAKMLKEGKHGELSATLKGTAYIRSRILPFPLNQLLYYTCLAAREEVQKGTKAAFLAKARRAESHVLARG
jgi:hypothetical protein